MSNPRKSRKSTHRFQKSTASVIAIAVTSQAISITPALAGNAKCEDDNLSAITKQASLYWRSNNFTPPPGSMRNTCTTPDGKVYDQEFVFETASIPLSNGKTRMKLDRRMIREILRGSQKPNIDKEIARRQQRFDTNSLPAQPNFGDRPTLRDNTVVREAPRFPNPHLSSPPVRSTDEPIRSSQLGAQTGEKTGEKKEEHRVWPWVVGGALAAISAGVIWKLASKAGAKKAEQDMARRVEALEKKAEQGTKEKDPELSVRTVEEKPSKRRDADQPRQEPRNRPRNDDSGSRRRDRQEQPQVASRSNTSTRATRRGPDLDVSEVPLAHKTIDLASINGLPVGLRGEVPLAGKVPVSTVQAGERTYRGSGGKTFILRNDPRSHGTILFQVLRAGETVAQFAQWVAYHANPGLWARHYDDIIRDADHLDNGSFARAPGHDFGGGTQTADRNFSRGSSGSGNGVNTVNSVDLPAGNARGGNGFGATNTVNSVNIPAGSARAEANGLGQGNEALSNNGLGRGNEALSNNGLGRGNEVLDNNGLGRGNEVIASRSGRVEAEVEDVVDEVEVDNIRPGAGNDNGRNVANNRNVGGGNNNTFKGSGDETLSILGGVGLAGAVGGGMAADAKKAK